MRYIRSEATLPQARESLTTYSQPLQAVTVVIRFSKVGRVCVTDMVLYNICGRIFDPHLIGTDSRRMEQICNSYIVQIRTDHRMIQRCFAYLFQSGGRGPDERFQLGHKE